AAVITSTKALKVLDDLNLFPQELLDSTYELADSFQESVDSSQEIVDLSQELLHDESNEIHETYKGQDLVGNNDPLPHINKTIHEFDGMYQPKKTNNLQNQHNKGSKKLNCNWKVICHLQLIFAPVNRQFSDKCYKEIHHLVVNGQCDLSTIWSLISIKYPDQLFLTCDLANIMAQLQQEHKDNTAQTNHYNFPLCLFVLINNHNKTRIVAQALMPDETIESFRW
ncbi:2708_t:CDS:2, partial [Gigaspora margarita]